MVLRLAVEQESVLRIEHDVVLAGFEFATATTGEWVVLAAELIVFKLTRSFSPTNPA